MTRRRDPFLPYTPVLCIQSARFSNDRAQALYNFKNKTKVYIVYIYVYCVYDSFEVRIENATPISKDAVCVLFCWFSRKECFLLTKPFSIIIYGA